MQANKLPSLLDAPLSAGTRVLLALDLNVSCQDGKVTDTFRIEKVLPTLEYLSKKGCRTMIISHMGSDGSRTLAPIAEFLKKTFKILFANSLSEAREMSATLSNGEFLLLENIRREAGEMANDPELAKRLASLADIYVNEAFSVSHRAHSSVVGVPKLLPSFAGFQFIEEVEKLSTALKPIHPSLFVLGGAKFETKLPLLMKFLNRYDRVFVGGALANDLFRAMGVSVGDSLVSERTLDLKVVTENPSVRLPLDFLVQKGPVTVVTPPEALGKGERVVDSGPKTAEFLAELAAESKFILWNGPLGEFERGFSERTLAFARAVAESGAHSIVGGGDTISAIQSLNMLEKFDFVSTGGGAMLDFLANETLPGIEALKK
ncbi:MAG: phosphoglycerate kinase [Candidatus Taylorbacteria bacterium RIFCSPHIGHO2_01_FULL_46_22b]|uniref:Phosphoglycerate kinase n=1 Tax=Candidatus Taylorbacteria bacterium RIFCSPHIGHO2_01_FULL_46_22b TaxID=1802301 RepID=A0A1G2M2Y3_9BACT|nr:MAG: phosphoglycerate kinase [Candidatus Taylorbacteria bacterium RIFCSPHIGHO2_01_FULL_46_22b]